MKKTAEIKNTLGFGIINNNLVILTSDPSNVKWKDHIKCGIVIDEKAKNGGFAKIGSYLARSLEEFGEIYLYNDNGECVQVLPQGCNLSSLKEISNGNVYIPNRVTKTYWEFTPKIEITDTNHLARFDIYLNGKFYVYMYPPNQITRINLNKTEESIVWQIKVTDLLGISSPEDVDLKDHPLGYQNYAYFQLESGELFAINSETGTIEWLIKHELSGGISIYGDKIYKKNNKLYEICAITGKVEKEKLIFDIVGRTFYASGRILTYRDVIVLWDVTHAQVALINRSDFSLVDCLKVNAERIGNRDGIVEWHENKLYILDMEKNLSIFERD